MFFNWEIESTKLPSLPTPASTLPHTHTQKKKKTQKGKYNAVSFFQKENNAVVYSVNTHAAVVCLQNSENRILPRDSLSGKKADV